MRRRIGVILAGLLGMGTLMLTPPQPASAVWACAGQGVMTTSPTYYPPFTGGLTIGNEQKTFLFDFSTVGACAHVPTVIANKSVTAAGIFSGWCGLSSGLGTTGNGNLFAWIGVGGILVLTGHILGLAHVQPNILAGHNCFPTGPGAARFLMTGAIALLNCPSFLGPLPDFDTLLSGDLFHVWFNSICIPNLLFLN